MDITKKSADFVVQSALWLLCGLMLFGMRYPLVGRDDFIVGAPDSLMWWSIALSFIYAAASVYLTRKTFKTRAHLIFNALLYLVAGIVLMMGTLLFINGVFDRTPMRTYRTFFVEKRTITIRRGSSYHLTVVDWRDPRGQVELSVGQEDYFGRNSGDAIQVTTSKGFLGYERLRGVK